MGRSIFPKIEPEREIARRVEELEFTVADRATSNLGTKLMGKDFERWTEIQSSWKFMDQVKSESAKKTTDSGAGNGNLVRLQAALDQIEGGDRVAATVRLATFWGETDPQGAVAWANVIDDAAERSAARQGIARGWAQVEPLASSEWLATIPEGPERSAIVSAFVKATAKNRPNLALSFALSVSDPTIRAELVDVALKPAAQVMPEVSDQLLRGAELSTRELEDYLESLASYRNGGGTDP